MALYSRQLLAFMAVAQELHFGRAAQRLHMSQPPLSQQVRLFEERVGVPLLERSTRAVRLTAAGAALRDAMLRMMDDGEAALAAARRVAAGETGLLRIGFTPTAAYRLIPAAIGAYRERHPQVHLSMTEGNTAELHALLRQERLDVAILRPGDDMQDETLHKEPIDSEPLVAALPAGHRLAGRRAVRIEQLAELPLVGFARQSSAYFHALLAELFSRNGLTPRYAMESLLPTLLALVEAGIGAAVVPASVGELRPRGVKYLPLKARVLLRSTLYLAYRRDCGNPAVPALREALRQKASA
ncbi:LysR family transcriptional regulator [Orrella sp. JC864]|uniref:LysR family transcriptional regulator n=1 Tax=Orrella sp. JC864 TaxID=3120298 RepID=UPI0012BB6DAA